MNLKKIISAAAACIFTAAAGITLLTSVSAAETQIAYIGPSADAFAKNDDGSTLRLNIYNEWVKSPMTPVKDINNKGTFEESINVTFTVSGLTGSCNKNVDGSDGDPYMAELVGTIGSDQYWGQNKSGNTVTNDLVAITGDGQYTVKFNLSTPSDTILCLILSTNINVYNYASSGSPADSGITFKIDKITTTNSSEVQPTAEPTTAATEDVTQSATGGVQPTPTDANEGDATEATDAEEQSTTNAPVTTAQPTITTVAANVNNNTSGGTSGNQVSNNTSNSPTTKDSGIAIAFAGLAATVALGVLTKIKKK